MYVLVSIETGAASPLSSKRRGLARGFNNHLSEARPIPVHLYIGMSYSFVCCCNVLLLVCCVSSITSCLLCVLCHFLCIVFSVTSCLLCVLCPFLYVVLQCSSTPVCGFALLCTYIHNTFGVFVNIISIHTYVPAV